MKAAKSKSKSRVIKSVRGVVKFGDNNMAFVEVPGFKLEALADLRKHLRAKWRNLKSALISFSNGDEIELIRSAK